MTTLRSLWVLSLFGALTFAACGSSSSKNADGGTTSGGGGPKLCASSSSTTCTSAETNAYATCVQNACDGVYTECLGPNYKSGSYTGVCGSYVTCVNACACSDATCKAACVFDTACGTCFVGAASCRSTCTVPACYTTTAGTGGSKGTGGGGTSGGGTGGTSGGSTGGVSGGGTGGLSGGGGAAATGTSCADLVACCNASTIQQVRDSCATLMAQTMNMESACATTLASVKASICPTL